MINKIPTLDIERKLWGKGIQYAVGIDEVGRGALAGPVVVGAVVFRVNQDSTDLQNIRDSKDLSKIKRETLSHVITQNSLKTSLGIIDNNLIDLYGISWAVHHAALQAIGKLSLPTLKLFIIADNRLISPTLPFPFEHQHIPDGDSICLSIAAASIVAKVWRDAWMTKLSYDPKYSRYQWDQNVGYGTSAHRNAIKKFGISNLHRKTFC